MWTVYAKTNSPFAIRCLQFFHWKSLIFVIVTKLLMHCVIQCLNKMQCVCLNLVVVAIIRIVLSLQEDQQQGIIIERRQRQRTLCALRFALTAQFSIWIDCLFYMWLSHKSLACNRYIQNYQLYIGSVARCELNAVIGQPDSQIHCLFNWNPNTLFQFTSIFFVSSFFFSCVVVVKPKSYGTKREKCEENRVKIENWPPSNCIFCVLCGLNCWFVYVPRS